MLQKQTVSTALLDVLIHLMRLEILNPFRLVGGTALALRIGHRTSVDIDLFSETQNDFDKILEVLAKEFGSAFEPRVRLKSTIGEGISVNIKEIKVDILYWKAKFIRPQIEIERIRMADHEDILAMKMNTFLCAPEFLRYTKKDFIDIAFLLDQFTLKEAISFYKEKYPVSFSSDRNILEGMQYIELADKKIMPKMFVETSWIEIKNKINRICKEFYKNEK